MKTIEEISNESIITEEQAYDNVIHDLIQAKEMGTPIDEGILGAIGGAIGGAMFGPKIMTAICNALGVDVKGAFGSLLTSRLILTAVAAKIGWKM